MQKLARYSLLIASTTALLLFHITCDVAQLQGQQPEMAAPATATELSASESSATPKPGISNVLLEPPTAAMANDAPHVPGPRQDKVAEAVKVQSQEDVSVDEKQRAGQQTIATESNPKLEFLFDGGTPESVEELQLMQERFGELAKKLFPATVNIQVGQSQGSGVVVTSDGYILTAAHVIQRPGQIAIIYFPDRKKRYIADTLGVSSGPIDSGMLKIRNPKGEIFPTIDLGISEDLKLGQWVMAVGHPGGFDVKRGLVARVGRIVRASEGVIRSDCTLVGGDSGGPLIDMNGDLIGIHSRIGGSLLDNLHVPVDQYSTHWDQLAQGLMLHKSGKIGINVVDGTNEIETVADGKSAKKAGIKAGDKIIKINDVEISNGSDIGKTLRKLHPRQKVEVVVLRNGKEKTLSVTLGE